MSRPGALSTQRIGVLLTAPRSRPAGGLVPCVLLVDSCTWNHWNLAKCWRVTVDRRRGPRGRTRVDPLDVNADRIVNPQDALLVINALHGELFQRATLPAPPIGNNLFLDVNGDNCLSPLDALWVINELGYVPPASVLEPLWRVDRSPRR